jgi:hypothetical protein
MNGNKVTALKNRDQAFLAIRALLGLTLFALFLAPLHAASNRWGEAQQYFQCALSFHEKNQLSNAQTLVNLALEREPNFQEAHLLQALIQYKRGAFSLADKSAQKAESTAARLPNDMSEHLRSEVAAYRTTAVVSSSAPFAWRVRGSSAALASLEPQVETLMARIANSMGMSAMPGKPIDAVLFGDHSAWDGWHVPGWMSSFDERDGVLRLSAQDPPATLESRDTRARHQLVHVLWRRNLEKSRAPLWFEEGVALYLGMPEKEKTVEDRIAACEALLRGESSLTADSRERALQLTHQRSLQRYQAFLESELAVLRLVKMKGPAVVPALLARFAKGEDFAAALQQEAGVTANLLLAPVPL